MKIPSVLSAKTFQDLVYSELSIEMPLWERFDIIKDDSEKEAYLILVVHGIGSNREVQTQNK